MNLVDALLAADAGKITAKQTEDYEVKRLSKLLGVPFILHLQEIKFRRIKELQDMATKRKKGRAPEVDYMELAVSCLAEGITNEEFNDPRVLKRFNATTKEDLFTKILTSGEITKISEKIGDLSGMDKSEDDFEEVKN